MQKSYLAFVTVTLLILGSKFSIAQESGNQATELFRLIVLDTTTLVGPSAAVVVHDGTDNDQVLPIQNWIASTTNILGATVTLEAQTPFNHVIDKTSRRNAQLDLIVQSQVTSGNGDWIVITASDVTNYAVGDNRALVSARSAAAGIAQLGLTVTFVKEDGFSLNSGAYVTTVVGTIVGN